MSDSTPDTLVVYQTFSPVATTVQGIPRVAEIAPGAHGVMIEPLRPNLLFNPSCQFNTSWLYAAASTIARDTTIGLTTGTSAMVTCDGTSAGQGVIFEAPVPQNNGVFQGTAWVYSNSGGEVINIAITYNAGIGTPTGGGPNTYTLKPGWQRLNAPALTLAATTTVPLLAISITTTTAQKVTFWATDAQLETGAGISVTGPSSFINGNDPRSAFSWDVSAVGPQVANGSFESGTASWASESGFTLTTQSSGAWIGTQCAVLTGSSGDAYQFVAASPSQQYTISWAYNNTVAGSTGARLSVQFWSASAALGTATTINMGTTASSSWNRGALSVGPAPVGTTRIIIILYPPGGSGVTLIDGIQMENRWYATPYGSVGTANATSATRAGSQVYISLNPYPGYGSDGIGRQMTLMGWSRLGYQPTSTPNSSLQMFASAAGLPYVGINVTNFYAVWGIGGQPSCTLVPTTPLVVGDLIFWAIVLDYEASTGQLFAGHAGSFQAGPLSTVTTLSYFTQLHAGTYYGDATTVNSYASRSPTALAMAYQALTATQLQSYWLRGPGDFDPTTDPSIDLAIGYGLEGNGLTFWKSGAPITASGGVYQQEAVYTGAAFTDDGAGNALPVNQRRFAIPITPDSADPGGTWAGINNGVICGLATAAGDSTLVDNWSVLSTQTLDPNEISLLLQRQ